MTVLDQVRRPYSSGKLFLISFSCLFLEMGVICWLSASVSVLAYFNNLILIACFFGLGVGCLLARRSVTLIRAFAAAFAPLVLAVLALQRVAVEISCSDDVLSADHASYDAIGILNVPASALAGFFVSMALFVVLGQELGRQLAAVGRPLAAYSWDIAGSLAGTVAYAVPSFLGSPPEVWFAIGGFLLLVFLEPANKGLGYLIQVNSLRIQDALDFSPRLATFQLRAWIGYYELP